MAKKFKDLNEKNAYYAKEYEADRKRKGLSRMQYYQIEHHENSGITSASKYTETIHKKVREDE